MSTATVTDLFCGAGGSSIGLVGAGLELKLAANHWQRAIETHAHNFPDAEHLCADISQYDPRRAPATDVLWASPECTNHSQAKSNKHRADLFDPVGDPSQERSRATMWDVPRFAERHRYPVILVENVVEVTKWEVWPAWVSAMHLLGYGLRVVSLNSMVAWSGRDAAPQSRDRVYIVCWRKGMRAPNLDIRPPCWCPKCETRVAGVQCWKNGRTVGKYRSQYNYGCPVCATETWPLVLPAAAAIDWTINCPRIGDRAKALSPNTLRRIEAGLAKYGPSAIVQGAGHTFERRPGVRTWPITAPLPTQMTPPSHGLAVSPFVVELRGGGSGARSTDDPLCTVTASGNHHGLVVDTAFGGDDRSRTTAAPFATQTGRQTMALVVKNYGDGSDPSMTFPPTRPFGTVTTQDHHAVLTVPFTVDYHGNGRAAPVDTPLGTVDCRDRHGLVRPTVEVDDCGFRMLTPDEIGRAQAFPDTYRVAGTARDRVRQYGNAVSPPAAALLAERIMAIL